MKKDPNWGDIIVAAVLAVVSFVGIMALLVFPYVKGKLSNVIDQTASVSQETSASETTQEPAGSAEVSNETSEEYVPVDPPEIEIPEDVTKINWEKVEHPDITDCDIVLIGDSIFFTGSDKENSTSIASLLEERSGARVYNLAIPGMCAGAHTNEKVISQQEAVKNFLNLTQTDMDAKLFNSELGRLANDDHTGRQLVVIMDCTINDYFMNTELAGNAYNEDTYFGAITNCINWISGEYPCAIVCYIKCHSILHGTNGYDFNNVGADYNMYKEQMIDACNYEGAQCITVDGEDGINYGNSREMTEDGTHLNYDGRTIEARIIDEYLRELLTYY